LSGGPGLQVQLACTPAGPWRSTLAVQGPQPAFDAPPPPAFGPLAAECAYLEGEGEGPEGLGRLRHAALYHSADAASGRGVYALLLPVVQRALVVVVQPGGGGQREVTPAVLDRCWREALQMQSAAAAAAGGAAQVRSPDRAVLYPRWTCAEPPHHL
jgi:hypothetical protein